MNEKALITLEYDKIITRLADCASTAPGKEFCRALKPMDSISDIISAQKETSDALARILRKGSLSFGGVRDIRDSLLRLSVGASLGIGELLAISSLQMATARAIGYGKRENTEENGDVLDGYFQALQPLSSLTREIDRCIISEEEIADDASPGLRSVRRSMHAAEDKIRTQLNSLLVNSRTYLQDSVITMRNGRYCVPVRSECKGNVPGMVHDQSSSGSTMFIEPMGVVKLNNELRELEIKEQKEIEAVLASLSNLAAEYQSELRGNLEILIQLDVIFAKAMLSRQYRGSEPRLTTKGIIRLKKARHPLLDQKKVVPIDVTLGEAFDLLVVTGPNTGGKTVSLKTVGLLTLMALAGLHIPANEGSTIPVFHEVYADIGDKQSIEQSLSTFSSHMTNIVSFLKHVDEHSLVLFDELGAGTDPTEGAALAIAILNHLHQRGIRTMATTHYSELKVFALSTPGVENACCEFDVETLRPTYHLLIGIPGKSNAFAIAGKLGLPDYIIDEAKTHLTEQDESFEDLLTDLETSKRTIQKEQEEIEHYKRELARLEEETRQKRDKLEEQRDRIIREANEKAHEILADAKETADETMRNFHKFGKANISVAEMEKERERLRKKMNATQNSMKTDAKKPKKAYKASDFKLGESVKVLSMNLTGSVTSLPDAKGNVTVQMGILRSTVNISDLEIIEEAPSYSFNKRVKQTGRGKVKMGKSLAISPEINLLGKTVDEAIAELDKYLDDASLAHLSSVRIVHGKGTGALRAGIHKYLKRQKHVKSFRLGAFGEGDAGVTIAELK